MNKKFRKYKTTEYGEYEFIVRKMYSLKVIKGAHETPYTKRQTEKLLKRLSKRFFKNRNILKLRWIKNRELNYGGIWILGNKKIPFVELHKEKKNINKGIYGLRAGIVLHEFSHALAGYKYGIVNHRKGFIKTFNKVLRFYHSIKKL